MQEQVELRNTLLQVTSAILFPELELYSGEVWAVVMEVVNAKGGLFAPCFLNGGNTSEAENTLTDEEEQLNSWATDICRGAVIFFSKFFEEIAECPFPAEGNVYFYFLRDEGLMRTPEIAEEDLRTECHPLSMLYHTMQQFSDRAAAVGLVSSSI